MADNTASTTENAQDSALKQAWSSLKSGDINKWQEQGGILHSNSAINALTGIPEMGARMFRGGQGLGDAFRETFYDSVEDKIVKEGEEEIAKKVGKGMRWGKLGASVWAAGTALSAVGGAARGALTDRNGNFDIPGIPLI